MIIFVRAILAVILLFIIMFIFYSKSGRFTFAKHLIIGTLILLLIGVIAFYEISGTKQSKLNRELLDAFNQNKTLVCKEHEVTSADFTFVGGTKVFTQKKAGQSIISIEDCEVK
ncbi:MAG: hypothetical protein LBF13_05025 [Campylobacteraceae bacterium]|jgi:uncharacterized protein (UPF0333 family)|nr:hypothetical protein [Campylobacteraceae bacterium]